MFSLTELCRLVFESHGFDFLEYRSFSYLIMLLLVSSSVIKDSLVVHEIDSDVYFIPTSVLHSTEMSTFFQTY